VEYPFKDLLPLDEVLAREGYYKDWTHLDPEVFYSLTQISEYIKTKGYGVDVRLLIAQLAEHFGLKTTQVVDLGNLIQSEHATLKQQVQQAVAQVNADRNALETQFNQSVAQMEADKDAVIANATVDSEVILARGGKPTLQARLDDTTAQLAQKAPFHASKFIGKLENGEPATVVFLGDSTTEQNATTNGQPNHVGLLKTWLENKYGGLVTVRNAGVSGNTVKMMWQRAWKDVLQYNPDLVVICSGINDHGGTGVSISVEEFTENYNRLIQEILSQTGADIIIRSSNITQTQSTNNALINYTNASKAVADRYGLGYFDLFNKMISDRDAGLISLTSLMNDNVHPNAKGHEYIFELFKDYFIPKRFIHSPKQEFGMISAKNGFRLGDSNATLMSGANWINNSVLAFDNPGKHIEFEYTGGDFTLIYVGATSTGQYKVSIDGVDQEVKDTYRPTVNFRAFDTFSVAPGKHKVKIYGQSTKNPNSSTTNLQIQAVIYKKTIMPEVSTLTEQIYPYLDVKKSAVTTLTPSTETLLTFDIITNAANLFDVDGAKGQITIKEKGLYQILFSSRITTDGDKAIEINYKANGNTNKRSYSRTSATAGTHTLSLDLLDITLMNPSQVVTFFQNVAGTAPTSANVITIVKIA